MSVANPEREIVQPNNTAIMSPAAVHDSVSSTHTSSQIISRPDEDTSVPFIDRLVSDGDLNKDQVVQLLGSGNPRNIVQYSEHIYKLLSILHEHKHLNTSQFDHLKAKVLDLYGKFKTFHNSSDPTKSKLYLVVEKNFDMLIKVSMDDVNLELSTKSIRFLTEVIMSLSYWEIYNLLTWKPAIYHFLTVIEYDLNECYVNFIKDYKNFNHKQTLINFNKENVGKRSSRLIDTYADSVDENDDSSENGRTRNNGYISSGLNTPINGRSQSMDSTSTSPNSYYDGDMSMADGEGRVYGSTDTSSGGLVVQHIGPTSQIVTASGEKFDPPVPSRFINNDLKSLASREKRKLMASDPKLARKVIKRANSRISTKSSNYDPDVVHECQLSSADEPGKMCLRRFSRKYELIRHQETVHSKKKKLFKCFVCVKQNPGIGPRIFTRHDTLAKHIRVNHKISGKEAKAEVAFSKKHAEVVEEGDITVHVGRRKTKVDFELRAHMEKRRGSDGEYDYSDLEDGELYETNNSIVVDEEDDLDNDTLNGEEGSASPEASKITWANNSPIHQNSLPSASMSPPASGDYANSYHIQQNSHLNTRQGPTGQLPTAHVSGTQVPTSQLSYSSKQVAENSPNPTRVTFTVRKPVADTQSQNN